MESQLPAMKNAAAAVMRSSPSFAEFLRKMPTFDLGQSLSSELTAVQQHLAGSPAPAPPSTGVVVYTVAELNSIVGRAMSGGGSKSEKRSLALAELRRRGPRLTIRGTVDKRQSLDFQDESFSGRASVYIWSFTRESDEDELRSQTGRTVTVNCNLRTVDILIEVDACRFAPEAAALASSGEPFYAGGFVRKAVAKESLAAAPGAGVRASEMEGVYLIQQVGFGVGGAVQTVFEPALSFKDGMLYTDPHLAPDSFNAALSRQKEPQYWGKLTRTGQGGTLVTLEGEKQELTKLFPTVPGHAGLALEGTYSHLGGGGNLAYGGNTVIHTSTSYTFTAGRRFETTGSTGGSGGSDYNPDGGFRVTTQSTRGLVGGAYLIDGWAIELKYDNGRRERLLFCSQDAAYDYICIGGTMFLKRRR